MTDLIRILREQGFKKNEIKIISGSLVKVSKTYKNESVRVSKTFYVREPVEGLFEMDVDFYIEYEPVSIGKVEEIIKKVFNTGGKND